MNLTAKRFVAGVVMAGAAVLGPAVWQVQAQAGQTAAAAQSFAQAKSAEETRDDLRQVLQQYPPSLGRVLVLDPTLLSNKAYLDSYPPLAQFLATRPEVARDPNYFLADYRTSANTYGPGNPEMDLRRESVNAWRNMFESMLVLGGFALFAFALGWAIKYLTEHRRWLRTTKTQSEVHAKLLERMTSTEDLKAYMESEAGQRFLQASPLPMEAANQQAAGAPFSRILWSVQVGIVLVALGIGFMFVRRGLETEVQQMIGAWGTLAIALGVGFAISAAASYVISSRLGLLDQKR